MKKQDIPTLTKSDQLPLFSNTEDSVFTEYKGDIYIGREKIKSDVKELLKDQAQWLKTSHLYEILKSTIENESMRLALVSSTEWDHVLSAKMLWHWQSVLDNILLRLTVNK